MIIIIGLKTLLLPLETLAYAAMLILTQNRTSHTQPASSESPCVTSRILTKGRSLTILHGYLYRQDRRTDTKFIEVVKIIKLLVVIIVYIHVIILLLRHML
jgi:hypothetical protein